MTTNEPDWDEARDWAAGGAELDTAAIPVRVTSVEEADDSWVLTGEIPDHLRDLLLEELHRHSTIADDLFHRPPIPGNHPVIFQTVPPREHSPLREQFVSGKPVMHHTTWSVDGPHYDSVDLTDWALEVRRQAGVCETRLRPQYKVPPMLHPDTRALVDRWCFQMPSRPGWTGSITGAPRDLPESVREKEPLGTGIIGPDDKRYRITPKKKRQKKDQGWQHSNGIIVEPGADSNPDARLMKLDEHGRWCDAGPVFPHGLQPAYRGRPAPIPWDSPLADPLADLTAHMKEE